MFRLVPMTSGVLGSFGTMRKLPLILLLAATGCAVDSTSRKEESAPEADPLVRERTVDRMDEIAQPARAAAEAIRAKVAVKDCAGVCDASKDICSRSLRVCDLAEDFPQRDDGVHERCEWVTSDCDESRGLCANCGGPAPAADY